MYTKQDLEELKQSYDTVTRILSKSLSTPEQKDNLVHSSERIAKAMLEMTSCSDDSVDDILSKEFEVSPNAYSDRVTIGQNDISAISICPHHLLPITYKVSFIVSNPHRGAVLGLSKYVRLIQELAKRPILQEEYAVSIVENLSNLYENVAVKVEGVHGCMQCRGVKSEVSTIVTLQNRTFIHNLF